MDRDQAEQDLTHALYMVLMAYRNDLKFDDFHILGKCNLILQGFVNEDGTFTDEYIELAQQALDEKSRKDFMDSLGLGAGDQGASLILPNGISRK
jgi:hypothetical protein